MQNTYSKTTSHPCSNSEKPKGRFVCFGSESWKCEEDNFWSKRNCGTIGCDGTRGKCNDDKSTSVNDKKDTAAVDVAWNAPDGYSKNGAASCSSSWNPFKKKGRMVCNGDTSWLCGQDDYWYTQKCESMGCDTKTGKCKPSTAAAETTVPSGYSITTAHPCSNSEKPKGRTLCSGGMSWFCGQEDYWYTQACGNLGCESSTGKCKPSGTAPAPIAATINNELTIEVPERIDQGAPTSIKVVANGKPVKDAKIRVDLTNIGSTDDNGILTYTFPEINARQIYAEKAQYVTHVKPIKIIAKSSEESLKPAPATVNVPEGYSNTNMGPCSTNSQKKGMTPECRDGVTGDSYFCNMANDKWYIKTCNYGCDTSTGDCKQLPANTLKCVKYNLYNGKKSTKVNDNKEYIENINVPEACFDTPDSNGVYSHMLQDDIFDEGKGGSQIKETYCDTTGVCQHRLSPKPLYCNYGRERMAFNKYSYIYGWSDEMNKHTTINPTARTSLVYYCSY